MFQGSKGNISQICEVHLQYGNKTTKWSFNTFFELIPLYTNIFSIDEAQFFDAELPEVCEELAKKGIRVIIAGLDMDYLGKPFGQMPNLLAKADFVTKLHAICMQCGHIANYSYRKVVDDAQVLLGAKDSYEPRCRSCYEK